MSVAAEFEDTARAFRRRGGGAPRLVVMAPDVHAALVDAERARYAEAVKRGACFTLDLSAAEVSLWPELVVDERVPRGAWYFAPSVQR